jgi:hypothetical protein
MAIKFSTHHIPDKGVRFAPGDIVHLDRSSPQVQIIPDPHGDHEVMGCRPATEFKGDNPLLRVDLKRIDRDAAPVVEPTPWAPRSRY